VTTIAANSPGVRSRTLLVSFLGAIVRAHGSWMPIAAAVELLSELGVDESSVRTAVFRLKERGWLSAERRGSTRGYALTPVAERELAAGDAIVWHSRGPASLADGWCIVSFTIPETARSLRHQLRSHLSANGFGRAGAALWIAPARELAAARRVIESLGLAERCTVFVGDYAGARDLVSLVGEGWDLTGLENDYREFITSVRDRLPDASGGDDAASFSQYLLTIDQWRPLAYRDPGLPVELVGHAQQASQAGELFEQVIAQVRAPAMRYAAARWPVDPDAAR